MTERNLNDTFIDTFGNIWYIKKMPDSFGYYIMGEAYGLLPDRQLNKNTLEEFVESGMLKFGWTAKDAKRWKS